MTIPQMLQSASEHHRAGRLAQAEHLYRAILAEQPYHADALHLLGVLANQTGHPQDACEWITKAIKQRQVAEYYFNLAGALVPCGKIPEAIAALERAIALKPTLSGAHANLGTLLQGQGQYDQAIACFHKAIALQPNHSFFHYNLGNAYSAANKRTEAVEAFQKSIALDPKNAQAWNNLGSTLHALDRCEEAADKFRRALAINPNFPEALNNLGNVLLAIGQLEEAAQVIRRAIAIDPRMAVAWNNLGNVLCALAHFQEAIDAYRHGIALQPDWPEIHNNLSIALRSAGNFEAAIASAQTALSQNSHFTMAKDNLAQALQAHGDTDRAIEIFEQAIAETPQDKRLLNSYGNALRCIARLDDALSAYRRSAEISGEDSLASSNYLFTLQFHSDNPEQILAEHKKWDQLYAQPLRHEVCPHTNDRSPHRRLRIGYFSPDFRNHCQSLFTSTVFPHHDHEQFEIFIYATVVNTDSVTEQIAKCADHWRNVGLLSDQAAADLIRADQIDILFDLTMHMGNCRPLVFTRKPAPVQVCWLAYPGTTGLTAIDYRLTDPHLDPPGFDSRYTEKSIRLSDTFWCYNPAGTLSAEPGELPDVSELPALKNGFITFGCLNDFSKVNAATLRRWAPLIQQFPNSCLHLLAPRGKCRDAVLEHLAPFGIAPDRIEFIDRQPRPVYLAEYHRIDLCLDTLPYNGHTTSLDAFWMGVPVLTQIGPTVVGRAGLSQLTNLQLPDFAADNDEQFLALGAKWASDLPALAEIRRTLRDRMAASPLMAGLRFTRNMESALRQMWINHTHSI